MPVTPVACTLSRKPGSSDHSSPADDLYFGSSVTGSMRTRSMAPGAARWPPEISAPSKAGPVGEEAATSRVAVAEHDLGIGADIDEQRDLVPAMRAFRQRRAGRVGADMAGDAGQGVDARALVDWQAEIAGAEVQRVGDGEREGRAAELGRIDAEEEVVHDRIADEDAFEDLVALDVAFGADLADQHADRLAHGLGHASRPSGFIIT